MIGCGGRVGQVRVEASFVATSLRLLHANARAGHLQDHGVVDETVDRGQGQ